MIPELEFIFEAKFEVGSAQEIGHTPDGERRVIAILGGTFEGPSMRGRVLPGGADYQTVAPDGTAHLQAHYTFETDSGVLISVVNRGMRTGSPEVLERIRAGHIVPPTDYYFRTTPIFETAAPELRWMCRSIFVASGQRLPSAVGLRVWRVG